MMALASGKAREERSGAEEVGGSGRSSASIKASSLLTFLCEENNENKRKAQEAGETALQRESRSESAFAIAGEEKSEPRESRSKAKEDVDVRAAEEEGEEGGEGEAGGQSIRTVQGLNRRANRRRAGVGVPRFQDIVKRSTRFTTSVPATECLRHIAEIIASNPWPMPPPFSKIRQQVRVNWKAYRLSVTRGSVLICTAQVFLVRTGW